MFDKLYYIFHSSVKSGFGHAERASFLLSASVLFYSYSLYFVLVVLTKSRVFNTTAFYILFGAFGVGIIYGASKYFVGTGRYRRIIDKYESPRLLIKGKRFLYRFISFGLFLGAFVAFIASGITLAKYLNPW